MEAQSSVSSHPVPAPPHEGDAQCPVPHAAQQPLPPGHPPVSTQPSSSLQPPSDPRCIFFRTKEDIESSSTFTSGTATPTRPDFSRESTRLELLALANINPLTEAAAKTLDPETNVVLASRTSQLALVQSSQVSHMLTTVFGSEPASASSSSLGITKPVSFPITSMSTAGDHNLKSPLYVIGGEGKAIWTKELEVALKVGGVDVLVHCLKDIPTTLPDEFVLGAILEREDPRDALVVKAGLPYKTLDDLPPGSVIGTSSVRRVAQLRSRYPSLVFSDVRGNLNTRLSKLDSPTGPYTAIVLAAAGLIRINQADRITAFLSKPVMLHSVGQGSLALEVRKPPPGADPKTNRDARILEMVKVIGDWRATARAEAERALLRELEGGCSIPVGVETKFEDHEEVEGARNEHVDAADEAEQGASAAVEGHTVTKSAVRAAAAAAATVVPTSSNGTTASSIPPPQRPGTLERLATDPTLTATSPSPATANGQAASLRNTTAPTVPSPPAQSSTTASETLASSSVSSSSAAAGHPPAGPTLKPYSPISSSSHLPPSKPIEVTLTAIVVSLDGKRTCSSTHSACISTSEEAAQLGVKVARELREEKGARSILEEVERHRQIAEEADMRRRREAAAAKAEKTRLAAQEGSSSEQQQQQQQQTEHVNGASKTAQNGHGAEEALRRLEELVPQAKGEMDRRGVPREDGQEKVWEV